MLCECLFDFEVGGPDLLELVIAGVLDDVPLDTLDHEQRVSELCLILIQLLKV